VENSQLMGAISMIAIAIKNAQITPSPM